MRTDMQSKFKPTELTAPKNAGIVGNVATNERKSEVDFLSVLNNSNSDVKRERDAKAANGGNPLSGAETYDQFLDKLQDKKSKERVPKNNLDKDDFLKLFVAQLQRQDPLSPEDSTEMASRLAHFNSLEQMLNVNKTLTTMLDEQKQSRNIDLIGYVGKDVEIDGGRIDWTGNDKVGANFDLKGAANQVMVEVRDSAGLVVYTNELGALNAGQQSFSWNGMRTDGKPANPGVYNFAVVAKGMNSEEVPVSISTHTKVTGIDLKDKDGLLHTGLGPVKFDQVKSMGTSGYSAKKEKKVEQHVDLAKAAQGLAAMDPQIPKAPQDLPVDPAIANIPVVPVNKAPAPALVDAVSEQKSQAK